MEKFREQVQRRVYMYVGVVLLSVLLGIFLTLNQNHINESVFGFQVGIIIAMFGLSCVQMFMLLQAKRNDTKLRMLYNQKHDERLTMIRSKAGMPMLLVTSSILLVAAIIVGYYNTIVFYTLVLAAGFQLTLGAIIKLYYLKTM